jgi:hypothetical protein
MVYMPCCQWQEYAGRCGMPLALHPSVQPAGDMTGIRLGGGGTGPLTCELLVCGGCGQCQAGLRAT